MSNNHTYETPHTYMDVSEMSNNTDKTSGSERHPTSGTFVRVLIILLIILMCLSIAAIAMAGISLGKYNELDNKYNDLQNRMDKMINANSMDITSESPQQKYYASCKEIKQNNPQASDGVYKMILDGTVQPLDLYCDMTTADGGWTLVYSHGFTDYENFKTFGNAVTPIPSWTRGPGDDFTTNVEVSTVPPLSETEKGALAFNLWNNIGSEFMIKSTINNWIKCKPGTGSLVTMTAGSITCEAVHEVIDCFGEVKVPNRLVVHIRGPALDLDSHYYYWDGYTLANSPTVDPCGKDQANQKKGVADPRGAIYIK